MAAYLQDVTSFLMASYMTEAERVHLDLQCEEVFLPIDQAIPCGLIVNEVVTNSLKHAFRQNGGGRIFLQYIQQNDRNELTIHDDGVGFGFDQLAVADSQAGSLRLRLIQLLVDQLGRNISN